MTKSRPSSSRPQSGPHRGQGGGKTPANRPANPRRLALLVLDQVFQENRPLDECLERQNGLNDLDPRDRALVRQLLGTTLRRLGQIDAILAQFLQKPPRNPDDVRLRQLLRLGAAQLLFLDIPDHAAVDTSVRLSLESGLGHTKGLVNAVLRRVATTGREMLALQDAARLNTPDWLWQSWGRFYGEDTARAIAAAHLIEPGLDITVRDVGKADDWAPLLEASLLPTGSIRRFGGGMVTELPGFAEGAWWVQDAAAALPARLLGDVRGKLIADLCAAPGGKTAQLAAAGAHVVAVDRSEKRLVRLHANMERLGLQADILQADLTVDDVDALTTKGPFDAILLDAPCSATGTIRRHPDVARLKKPADLANLIAIQRRLLNSACDWVKPGGMVVYCTCSLEPAEGEQQIERLLRDRPDIRRVPITANDMPGLDGLVNTSGDLRCTPGAWPDQGGLDGFFAARLRRAD